MIVGQRGEVSGTNPREDGDDLFREHLAELVGKQAAKVLRVARHLDHRSVAGGQDADERAQGEEERVVPGGDDPHDALGLRDEPVGAGRKEPRNRPTLRLDPFTKLLPRVTKPVDDWKDFEDLRLLGTAVPEVLSNGLDDRVGVFQQDSLDRV